MLGHEPERADHSRDGTPSALEVSTATLSGVLAVLTARVEPAPSASRQVAPMKKQGTDPFGNPIPVGQLYALRNVVVQPTTLCNLDCGYCYLPDRARALHMQPSLARKI